MPGMTTANGSEPERLNSRTITVFLPQRDIDYAAEIAEELGVTRNRAMRLMIEEHRKLRAKRLARKR